MCLLRSLFSCIVIAALVLPADAIAYSAQSNEEMISLVSFLEMREQGNTDQILVVKEQDVPLGNAHQRAMARHLGNRVLPAAKAQMNTSFPSEIRHVPEHSSLLGTSPFARERMYRIAAISKDGTLLLDGNKKVKLRGVKLLGDAYDKMLSDKYHVGILSPNDMTDTEPVAYLKNLCWGKRAFLELDPRMPYKDGVFYGYVLLEDGTFVNAEMIKEGYASCNALYPFHFIYLFSEYEKLAIHHGKGMWR